jgi:uncharacterized protein YjiS (DUF1127 family)
MTTVAKTTTASFFETAFEVLVTRARESNARRAQRIALASLLEMDPRHLDDIGLSAADVVDAFTAPPPAARHLEARRAARASSFATQSGAATAA